MKLRNSGLSAKKSEEICQEMKALPWDGYIKGFEDQDLLLKLRTYCSRDWLHSVHINHMLQLLGDNLKLTANATVSIQLTYHVEDVLGAYYNGNKTYRTSRRYRALRELAQDLATGIHDMLAMVGNVDGDHWIALMVNFRQHKVYYGDSAGHPINKELRTAYTWWFSEHNEHEFEWVQIDITEQEDGYLCGLLATNALAHVLDPNQFDLMDAKVVDAERVNVLKRVIRQHNEKVRTY